MASRELTIKWLRGLADEGGKDAVNNIDARCLGRIADDLEALSRRVVVLEMVIQEELDEFDCRDEANRMIVENIHERGASVALASDQLLGGK